jgi:mycothiol system anti-sigma-R factor
MKIGDWLRPKKAHDNYNCRQTLQKVMLALDDELSEDEQRHFMQHLNGCNGCLEKFEIEKSFKKFLCDKISRRPVPQQLIDEIKSQIRKKVE